MKFLSTLTFLALATLVAALPQGTTGATDSVCSNSNDFVVSKLTTVHLDTFPMNPASSITFTFQGSSGPAFECELKGGAPATPNSSHLPDGFPAKCSAAHPDLLFSFDYKYNLVLLRACPLFGGKYQTSHWEHAFEPTCGADSCTYNAPVGGSFIASDGF